MGFFSGIVDTVKGALGGSGGALGALNPLGVIGTAGALGGDLMAYQGQKETNEQNAQLAREQMAFQERMANSAMDFNREMVDQAHRYQTDMSNTAYSRAMDDMRESGLNPILAYSQGGASTPIGQTMPGVAAVGQTAQMMNPAGVFSGTANRIADFASTAMDVPVKQMDAKHKAELAHRTYEETRKVWHDANLSAAQYEKVWKEVDKLDTEIRQIQAQTGLTEATTAGVSADNVQKEIVADFLNSAEFFAAAKYIGISPSALGAIIRGVFLSQGRRR